MRSAALLLSLFTLVLTLPAAADEPDCPEAPHHLRVIAVDPGHGGTNEGAVGVAGIYERFLTMDVAKRLQTRLLGCWPDVEVVLTRLNDIDVGLSERTHLANLAAADVLLSVHFNAAENTDANGIEVWYLASEEEVEPWPADTPLIAPSGAVVESILRDLERTQLQEESAQLASVMHDHLIAASHATSRGVKQAGFRVLRGALMPAVVLELGFLTHPREGVRLLDNAYRERLITGIIAGLADWDGRLQREDAAAARE